MMIPFSKKNIINKDLFHINKILKSGWLTHGKYTEMFQKKFANFTGSKYAITVSSCTAGLHLSCISQGLKKGDEVIVPSITHTATAHAVSYTGAKPVFADVSLKTGNINLIDIKKKLSKKTKGVIVVHMAGFPCEIDEIANFCKQKKLFLIEDCAHGLGTFGKKKHVGNYGVTGVFSFYPTKQITTGEGGMIILNSKSVMKRLLSLKAFGINKDIKLRKKPGDYDVKELGLNYRMTDFQAAIGLFQLERYKNELKLRKKNAKIYEKFFSNSRNIRFAKYQNKASYFIFQIFLRQRDKFIKRLKEKKIGFSIHYARPVHLMSYYKKNERKKIKLPNSEKYSKENISLPVHSGITKKQIMFINNILSK